MILLCPAFVFMRAHALLSTRNVLSACSALNPCVKIELYSRFVTVQPSWPREPLLCSSWIPFTHTKLLIGHPLSIISQGRSATCATALSRQPNQRGALGEFGIFYLYFYCHVPCESHVTWESKLAVFGRSSRKKIFVNQCMCRST